MQNPSRTEFAGQQSRVLVPEILNVLEYDMLDIIILNKFLKNTCYTVNDLYAELLDEGRVKNICVETIRKRLEDRYVERQLMHRIKSSAVIYDINDSAVIPIRNLIRRFIMVLGVTDIL